MWWSSLNAVFGIFARKSQCLTLKTFSTCPKMDVRDASEDFKKMIERWKMLAKLLDISEEDGRKIAFRNKTLFTIKERHLQKNISFLKEIHAPLKQIFEHPEILCYFPTLIQQRYHCLNDFGIRPIGVPEIVRYNLLMRKCASEIQALQLLPQDVHPVDHLLAQIGHNMEWGIISNNPGLKSMSLLHIKKVFLLELLCQKLNCSRREVLQLISTYPSIAGRSISFLLEIFNILTDRIGFSRSKIKTNGYLLTIQPENSNAILNVLPQLGAKDVACLLLKFPRILSIPIDQLIRVNECVKKFGITEFQIAQCGNVYTLKPATIEERLIEIMKTSTFESIKTYPRILFLVYHFNKAKERLQLLKTAGNYYTTITLDLLTASNKAFHRNTLKELLLYLSVQFDRTELEIKKILVQHPYLRLLHLQHAKDIVPLLINRGFTKTQIFNALHIVLYNRETIEMHVDDLEHCSAVQLFDDWRNHPYILQLLLYLIEKSLSSLTDAEKVDKCRASAKWDNSVPKDKSPRYKYGKSVEVLSQRQCDSYEQFLNQ